MPYPISMKIARIANPNGYSGIVVGLTVKLNVVLAEVNC